MSKSRDHFYTLDLITLLEKVRAPGMAEDVETIRAMRESIRRASKDYQRMLNAVYLKHKATLEPHMRKCHQTRDDLTVTATY